MSNGLSLALQHEAGAAMEKQKISEYLQCCEGYHWLTDEYLNDLT